MREEIYRLQIEQAAAGCVSGQLDEWPMLIDALEYFGQKVSETTTVFDAKEMSRDVLARLRNEELMRVNGTSE